MRRENRYYIVLLGLVLSSLANPVAGQVVQLPTYRSFSIGTSVLVPDGGIAHLGGVSYGVHRSSARGMFLPNRSLGSSLGSSNVYANATIIDHEELDRRVLAEAARQRANLPSVSASTTDKPVDKIRARAQFLSAHISRNHRGTQQRSGWSGSGTARNR